MFSIEEGWKDVLYKLPVTKSADNVISEDMDVSLLLSNLLTMQINRKTKLTGNYIEGTMTDLETMDGYRDALRATMNKDYSNKKE